MSEVILNSTLKSDKEKWNNLFPNNSERKDTHVRAMLPLELNEYDKNIQCVKDFFLMYLEQPEPRTELKRFLAELLLEY